VVLIAGTVAAPAAAQPAYQHLRIIAPAAPGGGWDQTARAMQVLFPCREGEKQEPRRTLSKDAR
jgi:tripartite-type tricarboxylate transporter receptor subunit TctC